MFPIAIELIKYQTYQDILATGIMENFTELVQEVEKRRS